VPTIRLPLPNVTNVALGGELARGELPGAAAADEGDDADGVEPQLLASAVNRRKARTPEQIATPRRIVLLGR